MVGALSRSGRVCGATRRRGVCVLVALGLREHRADARRLVALAGEQVVHDDGAPDAGRAKAQLVQAHRARAVACRAVVLAPRLDKEAVDEQRELAERAERAHEPAVAERPLLDIVGLDAHVKDLHTGWLTSIEAQKLEWSPPLDHVVARLLDADGIIGGLEKYVDKRRATRQVGDYSLATERVLFVLGECSMRIELRLVLGPTDRHLRQRLARPQSRPRLSPTRHLASFFGSRLSFLHDAPWARSRG